MARVRMLHTSDWQIGMTRHFLGGEAQPRYASARLDAIRQIGEVARREECDLVVVAGDVFDSNLLASQTVRRALEAMRSINCPVYLLPGNHDALDAASVYHSRVFTEACPEHVHPIVGPGLVSVQPGVDLVAAPLFSNRPLSDLVEDALRDLEPAEGLRIVVGHGQVEGVAMAEGNPAALQLEPMERALANGVVHYVALGDRHSRLAVGSTGRIHYSGSPEVTDVRDSAAGDVLVVDLDSDGGIDVTAHRVGQWRFVNLSRDVNNADDLDDVDAELSSMADKERTVVRTALTGTLGLADKARLDALLLRHTDVFAALYPWERHTDVAVVVDPAELTDLGVGGFVASAANDLAGLADAGGDQAQAARDALSLLYRLAGGGLR